MDRSHITKTTSGKLIQSGDLKIQKVGDSYVILDVQQGNFFETNLVAAEIIEYLKKPKSVEEIINYFSTRINFTEIELTPTLKRD